MTNDPLELRQELVKRRYDPTQRPKAEQVIFTINGKVIATLENYIVWSGAPKSLKSGYLGAAVASAFVPAFSSIFGMKITLPENRQRIGYFDTEMSSFDFYRQMDRIKNFADKQNLPDTFDAFTCREDMPGKIRKLIESYLIDHPDCSLLVIDGLLDLCLNYNDEKESKLVVLWLKRITRQYNILIMTVIHLGKGHGETLGHLGSNTDRWAQSTLLVERNREAQQFVLKPKFLRSSDDFDPIALMNFNGRFQQVPYEPSETITIPKKPKK